MKTRLAAFLVVAIVVPGCFRDPAKGTPPTSGQAVETILKSARVSGRQEVPPNSSTATGDATVEVSFDRLSVQVTVNFSGLVDTTDAHIHVADPGFDGPIILPLAEGGYTSPLVVILTQDSFVAQPGAATFADAVDAMLSGRTYVNLHTASFPDGEIRGQVGPVTMTAQLDGLQEVPPVETPGTGSMILSFNNDQSAMTYQLAVAGLSSITAAHIHAAPGQVDGPIIFPLMEGNFFSPLSGTLTNGELTPQPAAGVPTFPDAVDAILSRNTYVNVHTPLYPDGEIRGQILEFAQPPRPPTVPTTTVPPTALTPPIPGYPNTGLQPTGVTDQGFPNTGLIPASTLNPGIQPTLSPTGGIPTQGVTTTPTTTPTAPSPTIIGPYSAR